MLHVPLAFSVMVPALPVSSYLETSPGCTEVLNDPSNINLLTPYYDVADQFNC